MKKDRQYFQKMQEQISNLFEKPVQTKTITIPNGTRPCAINIDPSQFSLDLIISGNLLIRNIPIEEISDNEQMHSILSTYKFDLFYFKIGDWVRLEDQHKDDPYSYEIAQQKLTHTGMKYYNIDGDIGVEGTPITITELEEKYISRNIVHSADKS